MVTRWGSTVIVALAGVGDSSAGAGRPRRTFLTNVSNGPSAGGKGIFPRKRGCRGGARVRPFSPGAGGSAPGGERMGLRGALGGGGEELERTPHESHHIFMYSA